MAEVLNQSLDFQHPLYLHPTDTLAVTLVSQVLVSSQNYPICSRAMKLALHAKNKLGFVDGTCKREDQESCYQSQWDRCNSLVLSWLINSVDKEITTVPIFSQNTYLVWLDLKERFDVVDGMKVFSLYRSINSLTQGTLGISAYYTSPKSYGMNMLP